MEEQKFTLAKSCQDWSEGFHWRRWGRDNFFLALKASCQKISTFISSHLNFFLSPDSAFRDEWIFYHLVFFWNRKTEINQIRYVRYFLFLSSSSLCCCRFIGWFICFMTDYPFLPIQSFMLDLDQTYIFAQQNVVKIPWIRERLYSENHPAPIYFSLFTLYLLHHKILSCFYK